MKMSQGEIFQTHLWETQRGDETHTFRRAWFLGGAKESLSQSPVWLIFIAKAFSLHSSLKSLLLLGTVNQGVSKAVLSFGVRGKTGTTAHQWKNLAGGSFNSTKFYSRLGVWPSTHQSAPLSCAGSSQGQNCDRKGQKWPLPVVTAVIFTLTCLDLGVAFPFGSRKEGALPPKYNSVSAFCPSPWPELACKNPFASWSSFFNSSSFLPWNTFEPWTCGFERLKGRVCGMWHLPGFLFHSCSDVQGQVRILLSNFYKLCPSHTHAESSEKKSYIQQGIKVLTCGLSAGLTTALWLWKLCPDMISYWNHLTCALHLNKNDDN